MRVNLGYSMGYAGTESSWTEEIPEEVVAQGAEALEAYLSTMRQSLFEDACAMISVWAEIE